jgi:hypothetical protein
MLVSKLGVMDLLLSVLVCNLLLTMVVVMRRISMVLGVAEVVDRG